ncbi:MAG: response regulator [Verrucomicrobiota bacterium]
MKNRFVLLVDDDRGVRESLGGALRSVGYAVTLASSGKEALELLHDTDFGLALFDLDAPAGNGWETFEQARKARPLLPLVLVTAHPGHRMRAVHEERVAVLEKPLDIPTLLEAMNKIVAQETNANR